MPRSKREYGDPTRKTLATAIAFVHFAQTTRGLHSSTSYALSKRYEFAHTRPHYRFNGDALIIAAESPIYKGVQWALDNGYRVRQFERHSLRGGIQLMKWDVETDEGWFASVNRYGDVFIHPEDGKWKDRTKCFNPSKGEQP